MAKNFFRSFMSDRCKIYDSYFNGKKCRYLNRHHNGRPALSEAKINIPESVWFCSYSFDSIF